MWHTWQATVGQFGLAGHIVALGFVLALLDAIRRKD